MEGPKIILEIPAIGLKLTETVVIGWIIMLAVTILVLWLTHGMKKVPSKRQVVAEWIVTSVNNLVDNSMGKNCRAFAPYIAALMCMSALGSLVSLLGFRPMTADICVTATWALMTFSLITFYKFKSGHGPLGYLKGFTQPIWVITPINIVSEIATPISLAFRHFGNIAGGLIITELIYNGLGFISGLIGLRWSNFAVFQVGIPAVLSLYFDLFSGCMQAFIFSMLTMAYISDAMGDAS